MFISFVTVKLKWCVCGGGDYAIYDSGNDRSGLAWLRNGVIGRTKGLSNGIQRKMSITQRWGYCH